MDRTDRIHALPAHIALPWARAIEAREPVRHAAGLLYAAHRLLRLLLSGRDGWAASGNARMRFADLVRTLLEGAGTNAGGPFAPPVEAVVRRREVTDAWRDLVTYADIVLNPSALASGGAEVTPALCDEIERALLVVTHGAQDLPLAAADPARTDLVHLWIGPGAPVPVRCAHAESRLATLPAPDGAIGRQAVCPGAAGVPVRPLLPCGKVPVDGGLEAPDGRLYDSEGSGPVIDLPIDVTCGLGRLLFWNTGADRDPMKTCARLVEGGLSDAAAEYLVVAVVRTAPDFPAGLLEDALDFLDLQDQLPARQALSRFVLGAVAAAEPALRETGDPKALADLLVRKQLVQTGPDKALTLQRLANLFRERLDDPDGAMLCLLSAVEVSPNDETSLSDLVEAATRDAANAAEVAGRLLAVAREQTGAVRAAVGGAAGTLFRKVCNELAASAAFGIALDGAPEDPELLEEATKVSIALGDHEATLSLLRRREAAAHDNATRADAVLAAGVLLGHELERPREAVAEFRKALLLAPGNREVFDALIDLASSVGGPDDVAREYASARARVFDPVLRPHVLIRYARFLADVRLDPATEADVLSEAILYAPEDADLLARLVETSEAAGQWRRAIGCHRRLAALRPDDSVAHDLRLAWIAEERLGDPESALGFLNEVLRKEPDNVEAHERVRGIHERQNLWGEVVRDLASRARKCEGEARVEALVRLGDLLIDRLVLRQRGKDVLWKAMEASPENDRGGIAARLRDLHREDLERDLELKAGVIAARALTDVEARADALVDLGRKALETPADTETARMLFDEAVASNPSHPVAVESLAALHLKAGHPEKVVPLVEPLAERAARDGDTALERRFRQLAGGAATRFGDHEGAAEQYARVVEIDPTDFKTRLLLGRTYAQAGLDAKAGPVLLGILEGETSDLSQADILELRLLTARVESRIGDHAKALELLDAVFGAKKSVAIEVVREVVAEAEAAGHLPLLAKWLERQAGLEKDTEALFAIRLKLGDLHKDRLGDPSAALRWYRAASEAKPNSKASLHKALDAAVAAGEFASAKTILVGILELEQDGLKLAQYHYASAMLARDNLGDPNLAREHLRKAVELNPDLDEAIAALEEILHADVDPEGLVELYSMLARQHRLSGNDAKVLAVLKKQAQAFERLHNAAAACEAWRQVLATIPDDAEAAARLADLLVRIPGRAPEALVAHRRLLAIDPTNENAYRAVGELCSILGDPDGAWCASSALTALGAATDAERARFEGGRQGTLNLKLGAIPPESFRTLVVDESADEGLGRVLSILYTPLRRLMPWKQPRDLGLGEADLVDLTARGTFQTMAGFASKILGIPLPRIFVARGGTGISKLPFNPPALAVGEDVLTAWRGKELRFDLGRALVACAPGFELSGVSDASTIRLFLLASLRIAFPDYGLPADAAGVEDLAVELSGMLPPEGRTQLTTLMTEFRKARRPLDPHGFLVGMDHTASRAGLFLANDLVVAQARLAEDTLVLSDLEFGDRLTRLCAYAVSERYGDLRRLMLQM